MTGRRFIVGSINRPLYPLIVSTQGPVAAHAGAFRFPAKPDGSGRLHSLFFGVDKKTGTLDLPPTWAAVETDDPGLVAEIDAAEAGVRKAEEQLRAAKAERQEVLAGLVSRCKPARVR